MKIGVLGAGALGCIYGAYLSKDNDVTLIVRRDKDKDYINANGVTIEYTDNSRIQAKIKAETNGSKALIGQIFDLIIVLVKGYDTYGAIEGILPCINSDTTILTLQNGMGNYDEIVKLVPKENIVVGTTSHGAYVMGKAHVMHAGVGADKIGSYTEDKARAKKAVEVISKSGLCAEYVENVDTYIWNKLFVNVAANAPSAILMQPNYFLIENEEAKTLGECIIFEALRVANASGQSFDKDSVLKHYYEVMEVVRNNRTSMLQDIEKGKRTEIDTINGAIVRLGERYNVPTPYNKAVSLLIYAKENIKNEA